MLRRFRAPAVAAFSTTRVAALGIHRGALATRGQIVPLLGSSITGQSNIQRRRVSSGTTNSIKWFDSSQSNIYQALPNDKQWAYTTLGTISTASTPFRNVSSGVLWNPQKFAYLFDAGEGTVGRLRQCRATSDLTAIFITHLHGDHVYGLPAVAHHWSVSITNIRKLMKEQAEKKAPDSRVTSKEVQLEARSQNKLKIFGPEGTYRFLRSAFAASAYGVLLQQMPFEICELASSPTSVAETPRGFGTLTTIRPDSDGTYTLIDDGTHTVKAAPIKHTVPCYGYAVASKTKRHMIPEKLEEKGLKGLLIRELLAKGQVISPLDGSVVKLDDVSMLADLKPKKVVVLGDTCDPSGMLPIAKDCDLLVHENTYPDSWDQTEAYRRGHSTPQMAGRFAKACNAKQLVLTHFGNEAGIHAPAACMSLIGERKVNGLLTEGAEAWIQALKTEGASEKSGADPLTEGIIRALTLANENPLPDSSVPKWLPSFEEQVRMLQVPPSEDLIRHALDECTRRGHKDTEPFHSHLAKALARGIFETKRFVKQLAPRLQPGAHGDPKIVRYETTIQENMREVLLRASGRLKTATNFVVQLSEYCFPPVPEHAANLPYVQAASEAAGGKTAVMCARDLMSVVVEGRVTAEALERAAKAANKPADARAGEAPRRGGKPLKR